MNLIKTKFKDLIIVKQKNNKDKRGSLRETFNNLVLKTKNLFSNIVQPQNQIPSEAFIFNINSNRQKICKCIKRQNIRLCN